MIPVLITRIIILRVMDDTQLQSADIKPLRESTNGKC